MSQESAAQTTLRCCASGTLFHTRLPKSYDFKPGVELLEVAAVTACYVAVQGVTEQRVAVNLEQLARLAD